MNRLGFTCSYTIAKDTEGTSPCGRRVTRRGRGESRCLGHRVVEWLIAVYGGGDPDRARWIYGPFFFIMFIAALIWSVQSGIKVFREDQLENAIVETIMSLSLAAAVGGNAIGFTLEHPLGGELWITFAPMLSITLALTGINLLSNINPSPAASLTDMLTALVDFVIALAILGGWLVFLLEYAAKYHWATVLTFFCETLTVAIVVGGVALALVSRGAENGILIMSTVLIGLAVAVRGIARLKKLANILRV